MPPKKRGGSDADSFNSSTATAPVKRQRVSLACDSCRTAREKCDGGRPHCGTCTAQNRLCSYTPTSKKRGVQTGYLRTIELSLAWLFEQVPGCEQSLHRLLTQNGGADGARVLGNKDKAGHRLYKRWNKSRIHKEIIRLISGDNTRRPDSSPSAAESETELDPYPVTSSSADPRLSLGPSPRDAVLDAYAISPSVASRFPTQLTLPNNWRRLLEIYFSYTHCWFPILDRDTIYSTALTYPPDGIDPRLMTTLPASHAQLWASLALAAFRDSASSEPSGDGHLSPARIFAIARRLVPGEDGDFEVSHICALLLHSLVLLGQGKQIAAWLLVGTASRLALNNYSTTITAGIPIGNSLKEPENRVLAACFMLDTLTSVCLGQPGHITTAIHNRLSTALASDTASNAQDALDTWSPVSGFGPLASNNGDTSSQPLSQPWLTFQQLVNICKILSTNMDSKVHSCSGNPKATPEDLARCLDPQFSFCNSLVYGGSAPKIPSAYLLQAVFLMATLELISGPRPSLFSNLIETIESCLENLGACGSPPLMVTLVGFVHRHGHMDRMHDMDKERWRSSIHALRGVWCRAAPYEENMPTQRDDVSQSVALDGTVLSPPVLEGFSAASYEKTNDGLLSMTNPPTTLIQAGQDKGQAQSLLPLRQHRNSNAQDGGSITASHSMSSTNQDTTFQSPSLGRGNLFPNFHNPSFSSQAVDYDAILDELGSIDCTDSIDVDPQFMANLGFAPGCDLGEMFQGDYGI